VQVVEALDGLVTVATKAGVADKEGTEEEHWLEGAVRGRSDINRPEDDGCGSK
jgi:hypothetical protein